MKKRIIESYATSILGVIIGLFDLYRYFIEESSNMTEFVALIVLAWVFIVAKETLLEGLFMNIFKLKK